MSHLLQITFPHVKHRTGMIIARSRGATDGDRARDDASRSAIEREAARIVDDAIRPRVASPMRDERGTTRGTEPARVARPATRLSARARPLTKVLRIELIKRLDRSTRAVDDAFARYARKLGRLFDAPANGK